MGQGARYLVWNIWFNFFIIIICSVLLRACTKVLSAEYPWCEKRREKGTVTHTWAFTVGAWWGSSWRAVLVSIRCRRWWGLWRDARRHRARGEPDQGRAPSLSPGYFPGIEMSHGLKPSVTFMIYGWNAGRIFHSLLRVPSFRFYMKSVTPLQKNYYRCCWKPLF